jgi:hypothetical protein
MFAVVGLTLDDVWAGALPQARLADALKTRRTSSEETKPIVIYTTDPADTQGPIARAKYKDRGKFVTLLYFNAAAVAACNRFNIPLNVLEQVDESGLPAKRVVAFEHSTATATK